MCANQWILLHGNSLIMILLCADYTTDELIDITDSNLDSELYYIDEYVKENPEGFVLISDLTSFIQVGDIVTFTPQKDFK